MKADITRSTFNPLKRYDGVRQQQGRVQLDADWNEQVDIQNYLLRTHTRDIIGDSGGPIGTAGFALVASGTQLRISAGHYFVDGILVENDEELPFGKQPFLPGGSLPTANGTYIAYLHVFQRHITALEDPLIREVALGGPDTATRSQVIWQVQLLPVAGNGVNCLSTIPEWNQLTAASRVRLGALAEPSDESDTPCVVSASAGYRSLENRLYRVEVHDGGTAPTVKWSRENGSVVTQWLAKTGNVLTIANPGKDSTTGYRNGDWVELFDDRSELLQIPGTMVRLTNVEGTLLTIDPATATGSVTFADFNRNPRLRRWDSDGLISVPNNSNPIDLEDGVQMIFDRDLARTGDYWTIPARVVTGDVEWPVDGSGNPVEELPHGIQHHFARLGVLTRAANGWTVVDCRNLYPVLTDQIELSYVSGDGQEGLPDLTANLPVLLAEPLIAGVSKGEHPVAGALVRFTAENGVNGRLNNVELTPLVRSVTVATNSAGLAICSWALDPSQHSQQITAELLDAGGSVVHLPIIFTGNLSTADQVAYQASTDCPTLAQAKTVKEALDILCQVREEGGCCEVSVGVGGDYPTVESAIKDLIDDKGRRRVSLCLIAQEEPHAVPNGILVSGEGLHLTIRGTGHPTAMTVGGRGLVFRTMSSVCIKDLDITASNVANLMTTVNVADVSVRGVNVAMSGTSTNSAAIRTGGAGRCTIADCQLLVIFISDDNPLNRLNRVDPRLRTLLLSDDLTFKVQADKVADTLSKMRADDRRRVLGTAELESDESGRAFATTFSKSRVDKGEARAALQDARLTLAVAFPSVAIHVADPNTVTTIENCLTNGYFLFYPGTLEFVPGDRQDDIAKISTTGRFSPQATGAAAWIRDCTFKEFQVGSTMATILTQESEVPFEAFSELRFDDNTITGSGSVAVGVVNFFDGNSFRLAQGVLGMSICERNVMLGNVNMGEAPFFHGAPAQLPQAMRQNNYLNIN